MFPFKKGDKLFRLSRNAIILVPVLALKQHCVRLIMMKIKNSNLMDGDALFGLPLGHHLLCNVHDWRELLNIILFCQGSYFQSQ